MGLSSILLRSSNYSFAALSDVVVSSMSVPCVMKLFEKFPRVAAAILWSASRDEAMVIEHLVNVGRRSAIERVAHCLLELRQRLHLVGLASESQFECPLTQYDLADSLGLSPIHVNRVLRYLREEGLLTVKSHTVIVHNLAASQNLRVLIAPISTKSSPKKWQHLAPIAELARMIFRHDPRLAQRDDVCIGPRADSSLRSHLNPLTAVCSEKIDECSKIVRNMPATRIIYDEWRPFGRPISKQ